MRKTLNVGRSIGLVIGSVLGSGLMILPGLVYNQVGVFSFYSWLGMGILIIPFMFIFSRIMIQYPSSGGLVNVVHIILGDQMGVSITWLLIISLIMLVPIVGIIGANYIGYLFNLSEPLRVIVAWLLLGFFTIVNTLDTRISLKIQGVTSILLLMLLFSITLISLFGSGERFAQKILVDFRIGNFKPIWLGMTLVFWAFLGWENLSFTTEEFKNVKKDLNIVIAASYLIMMLLYLGLSAGVIIWLDPNNPETIRAPLAEVARVKLGAYSGATVATIAFLIMLININAWVWGPSRMVFDAGRKNIIPGIFSRLNRHHTPHYALYALLFSYSVALMLVLVAGPRIIPIAIKQVNSVFLLLYILSIISFIKISKSIYAKGIGALAAGMLIFFFMEFGPYLILPAIILAIILLKLLIKTHANTTEQQKIP
ncbi:MAG: amino acid permease [Firmicutes bacterium]|nr:amino acid permease [Bacillota bacterium]